MALHFEPLNDDLLLLVIGERTPTNVEWQAWIDFISAGTYRQPRVIVHTAGGGPDASQRRALANVMCAYPSVKIAVMVDSVVGRGIVTALGWMYGKFAAFGTPDLARVLRYLELPASASTLVALRIAALREEMAIAPVAA